MCKQTAIGGWSLHTMVVWDCRDKAANGTVEDGSRVGAGHSLPYTKVKSIQGC